MTDPITLLRQHRASFPGSTAQYAAEVIGTIPRHVPSARSLRRWLAGSVPIPPEVVAWLESQPIVTPTDL